MSAESLEALLARVLVDAEARRRFRADPAGEAERAGLTREEIADLDSIDWVGLELAASSFAHKRAHKTRRATGLAVAGRWLRHWRWMGRHRAHHPDEARSVRKVIE